MTDTIVTQALTTVRPRVERSRPPTYPEVLRAVAHALSRPGADLPDVGVSYCTAYRCGDLMLRGDTTVAGMLAWLRVMDDVRSIELAVGSDSALHIRVFGSLSDVAVYVWTVDRVTTPPAPPEGSRGAWEVTVAELEALAGVPVAAGSAVSS